MYGADGDLNKCLKTFRIQFGPSVYTFEGTLEILTEPSSVKADLNNPNLSFNCLLTLSEVNYLIHHDDVRTLKNLLLSLKLNKTADLAFRIITAARDIRWLRGSASMIYAGNPGALHDTLREELAQLLGDDTYFQVENTERSQVAANVATRHDRAIREDKSVNIAHAILNTINEACYQLDSDAAVVFVNRQALEWWSKKEEEVIGKNIWKLFPECLMAPCYDAIQVGALDNRQFTHYEYISPILNRWIFLRAMPIEGGCIVIFHDIHDRKKAGEEQLNNQAHFIRSIADTAPVIITISRYPSGEIEFINTNALEMLGFDTDVVSIGNSRHAKSMHPNDVPSVNRYNRRFDTLMDNEENRVEYRIKNHRVTGYGSTSEERYLSVIAKAKLRIRFTSGTMLQTEKKRRKRSFG